MAGSQRKKDLAKPRSTGCCSANTRPKPSQDDAARSDRQSIDELEFANRDMTAPAPAALPEIKESEVTILLDEAELMMSSENYVEAVEHYELAKGKCVGEDAKHGGKCAAGLKIAREASEAREEREARADGTDPEQKIEQQVRAPCPSAPPLAPASGARPRGLLSPLMFSHQAIRRQNTKEAISLANEAMDTDVPSVVDLEQAASDLEVAKRALSSTDSGAIFGPLAPAHSPAAATAVLAVVS